MLLNLCANSQDGTTAVQNNIAAIEVATNEANIAADPSIYAYSKTTFCLEDSVLLGIQNVPANVNYTWHRDGIPVGVSNKTPYGAMQPGTYTVVVTYSNGSSFTTNGITLYFGTQSTNAPAISASGPTSICNGQSVNLRAANPGGLHWQKDGIPIINAFNQDYTATVGGSYRVKYSPDITTGCPGYSNAILVTVNNINGPVITESSHASPLCVGSSFTISSSIANVQWQKDGVNISGATGAVLTVTENGAYRAIQTGGSICAGTSNQIVISSFLPIQPIPVITATGPTSFCGGGSVLLSASVSVTGVTLQWQLNGIDIGGATNATYTATQSGTYTASVTGSGKYCTATGTPSNSIVVTASGNGVAPVITANGTTTFCSGGSVIFTSNLASVQWQKDGVDISGATSTTYTATQAGIYRAVIVNAIGCNGISNIFTVTILSTALTPVITATGPVTVCIGNSVGLTSSIAGVQWQLNGTDIGGATAQTYSAMQTGNYRAYVAGAASCGINYSNVIAVTVNGAVTSPVVTAASVTSFCTGDSVILSSSVPGVQWRRNGVDIAGATAQTYAAKQSGVYTVLAGTGSCTSLSNAITVTSIDPSVAPVITAAGTLNICTGASVVLTSNLPGVQWQLNGINISGAAFQTYVANTSGIYRAFVQGSIACGATYSNTLTVAVSAPPTPALITAGGPTSFCSGSNVVLTSATAGVQWQLNGVDITGATNIAYTATQGGVYTAVTTNAGGCTAVSNGITVTVTNAAVTPVISAAGSVNICAGNTVILASNIGGIQWQLNGADISGATTQAYNAGVSGTYRAYVPGGTSCGISYSNILTIAVTAVPTTPVITAGGPVSFCTGGSVTLSSTTLPIQWTKDGVDIASATNQTFVATQGGIYRAVASSGSCTSASNSITIIVSTVTAPVITASTTASICSGNSVLLTSNTSNVQWQLNGSTISGAGNQTYSATQAGVYTATTTNGACTAISNALTVSVTIAPTAPVVAATGPVNFCSGGNVSLASTVAGVQWTKDGADIGGTTSQTLNVTQGGVYTARITSSGCSATSNAVTVTVTAVATPTISSATSLSICSGSSVTLASNISTVQWQFNGANIANAAGATYSATVAGNYTAVNTNGACTATSNVITVGVTPAPAAPVIAAAGPVTFCDGSSVVLASTVGGVQWIKDGVNIASGVNQTYTATLGGKYRASLSSGGCTSLSNEITVVVNFPAAVPLITTNAPLNVCGGTAVTFTSTIAGVTWQKDNINVAVNAQTFAPIVSGVYRAVSYASTCPAFSNSLTLTVNPSPVASVISAAGPTTFCEGGNVLLASTLAGVQWLKDDINITSATNQTYTATLGGKYRAAITNGGCTSLSNEITVVVNAATSIPLITAAGNVNICNGNTVKLTSTIAGVTWQRDSAVIAANVQSIDAALAGSYRAVSVGGICPGFSNIITITVAPSPGVPVIAAASPISFCEGDSVVLASTLRDVTWMKDGIAIATGQTITAKLAGKYKAFINNATCTNYSNEITVTINIPTVIPTVTSSSTTNNICANTNLVLTSNIATVSWQKDLASIAVNTPNLVVTQTGSYRAVLINGTCPAYSAPLLVTVLPTPATPVVSAMGPVSFCTGDSVVLFSNVPNVQWFLDGNSVINNLTSQTYTARSSGTYKASISSANGCNTTSNPVIVMVNTPALTPVVTNATSSATTFCENTSVMLVSNMQSIQWQKNGVFIPGATSQTYNVTETGSYRAVFAGSTCPAYSSSFLLTMIPQPLNPVIYRPTANNCDTGNVMITSTINAGSMRWQKDTADIPNANMVSYTASATGNYRMIISLPNQCASYSNILPVKVNTALKPVILWDGNEFRTFTNYSSYQWYLNGAPIIDATYNTFKPTTPGSYKVITTTTATCVLLSDAFQLLVTAVTRPPTIEGNIVKQYPNPANSEAWIELAQVPSKAVTVRLLTVTGAELQQIRTRQQKLKLNTSTYASGLYFIEVSGGNERTVFKLILNK